MKASYRWLKDLVPGLEADPSTLAEHLALRGAPVEELARPGAALSDIVIARVLEAGPHPNADRLSLCKVDAGGDPVSVVCGAPNVRAGGWYPFAPVGAVLPGDFRIKKAKIRGEVSEGMLCSAKELRLGVDHSGIMELNGEFEAGEGFVAALGLDDVTLDVEITANRGDLLSHAGLARELAAKGDGSIALPRIPDAPEVHFDYHAGSPVAGADEVSVEVRDDHLCPRYLGAVLRGVSIGPSPTWLQSRLRGAGARPINNVVDATNYVMLELGQPLHAFDLAKLKGSSIVVRRAGPDEKEFTTLDDGTRRITSEMLMICDSERPVAIAGVMGGLHSEVDGETRDILLECAWFEPKSIRATRKALGMSTDASYRFERGIDPDGMQEALERCVQLILAVAGGSLVNPVLDCGPGRYERLTVPLRLARIERVLGIPFTAEHVRELLEPLGFALEDAPDGALQVQVPGFRSHDVRREVDLIEEVARTHGYDAFPQDLGPYRPGTVPDHPLFQLEDELRETLAGRGLFETQTPAFVPPGEGDVEVSNPLASTEPFMRRALLPSLVRRVEYNLARGNRDVRLFELGTSFTRAGSGLPPVERTHLAVVLTGRRSPMHWSHPSEAFDAFDLKGVVETVAARAYRGAASVELDAEAHPPFDAGSGFTVRDGNGAVVGRSGRIQPDALDVPAWTGDVWGMELTLPAVPEPAGVSMYSPLPHFPAIERDLALIVPDAVPAGAVLGRILEVGGALLEQVTPFDLYGGPGVPEGTRSIAFRLRFRASDRTLKDDEVDRAIELLLGTLEDEFGVRSRG